MVAIFLACIKVIGTQRMNKNLGGLFISLTVGKGYLPTGTADSKL